MSFTDSKEEVISWAKQALDEEGLGNVGRLLGETKNGFYMRFHPPLTRILETENGILVVKNEQPAGMPGIFLSKEGYLIEIRNTIPFLLFDKYLSEGKIQPREARRADGTKPTYLGLDLYAYDFQVFKEDLKEVGSRKFGLHEKYPNFPMEEWISF